jgi:Tol biopolymer transport system component
MLVYQTALARAGNQMSWVDRAGKRTTAWEEPSAVSGFWLSPDGTRVVTSVLDPVRRTFDLWLYDIAKNLRSRFTFEGSRVVIPAVWSPDGASVAFSVTRNGRTGLYRKAANLSGAEELLVDGFSGNPSSWSPDGETLLFARRFVAENRSGLYALPLKGERKPVQIASTAIGAGAAQFSPDGRWIAYSALDSQRSEVYIVPFPGPGGMLQVSSNGGTQPRWRSDGQELFYEMPDGTLAAAEIKTNGASLAIGRVQTLFRLPVIEGTAPYAVFPQGQRFLVSLETGQSSPEPLTLVQNWTVGLKK